MLNILKVHQYIKAYKYIQGPTNTLKDVINIFKVLLRILKIEYITNSQTILHHKNKLLQYLEYLVIITFIVMWLCCI